MLVPLLLLASTASALTLPTLFTRQTTSSCASGVHIIVARASTEPQGEGIIGQVATSVKTQIPGSDSVAVVYPATLQNYQSSESQGVSAMTSDIEEYVQSCPDAKIVLMGYSQGAQVVADTLIGSSSSFGGFGGGSTSSGGLATQYKKNIIAAIQMGDPSHVPNLSIDVGTSTKNGVFPRSNSGSYASDGYSSLIQSYCDSGDEYCDSGNSLQVHLSYVQKYGTQAASFVVSKYKA